MRTPVSWIMRRPLLTLTALALTLRVACAVATEFKPLFPAYYYTDATQIHEASVRVLSQVQAGIKPSIAGPLSLRLQVNITVCIYRIFGPHPLVIKLFNALIGALGAAAYAWALLLAFPAPVALASGALIALWPSNIFYTSQNLKEAPVEFLVYAALGAAFSAGLNEKNSLLNSARFAFVAALALFIAGCYRSYVLVCMTGALVLAYGFAACAPRARRNALIAAAFLVAALALYPTASHAIYARLGRIDSGELYSALIPVTEDQFNPGTTTPPPAAKLLTNTESSVNIDRPTSPEGISRTRRWRQFTNRLAAKNESNREIGTQIYPDAEFKSWGDILAYLPKGAFAVLFMPLPGLYPMEGKLGRWAAGGENLILLLVALLAAVGVVRGPKTPARLGLLAFFAAMTTGAALLEYDLGSAARHKLLYFPMLFPFAVEGFSRLFVGPARADEKTE